MTIQEIRALTSLSQPQFSERYHIPLPTLRKWEQGKREPPDYLVELLEFKVREDMGMENITPEEFYQKMIECEKLDTESAHVEMDYLLCETLKQLGYSKGIEVFESKDKWYS